MNGAVAELVDAGDSKSPELILESSSLSSPTIIRRFFMDYLMKEKAVYKKNNILKKHI